jgi:phosphoglycolate phosphatase-like HAD superfamily hydrolase
VLLLFDIDGTLLLKASAAHVVAVHEALREVYGVTEPAGARVEAAGRTDGEIAREICLLSGVTAARFDRGRDDFRVACVAAFAVLCPADLSAHVAPGAVEVLDELTARDDVVLGLVTGNLEPIARLKLNRAGLGRFFAHGPGGFGSDADDRTELPSIARRRAGGYPRRHTVVIGDTPLDIACARADGVRCIAVATGPFSESELAEADAVVNGVRDVLAVL